MNAITNFLFLVSPAFVYAVVARFRAHLSGAELATRLGLRLPHAKYWAAGLGLGLVGGVLSWVMVRSGNSFTDEGSPVHFLVGQKPNADLVWRALLYAFVATGFAEEILFRGLIAGVLFRRVERAWLANVIQGAIFTAPHLLILLLKRDAWRLLWFIFPFSLVLGWLLFRSKSVVPSALVHSLGNFGTAMAVLRW
jgi:membrane protease YdiL (CAAX protease family)